MSVDCCKCRGRACIAKLIWARLRARSTWVLECPDGIATSFKRGWQRRRKSELTNVNTGGKGRRYFFARPARLRFTPLEVSSPVNHVTIPASSRCEFCGAQPLRFLAVAHDGRGRHPAHGARAVFNQGDLDAIHRHPHCHETACLQGKCFGCP